MSCYNLLSAISDIGNEIRAVLITLAVVAVVLGVIWLCIKFQSARIMVFTILACIYLVFTMFSLLSVITYYKAHGGIFGGIDKIEKLPENDLIIDETNLQFNFTNVSLKAVENGYSAGVNHTAVIDLENAKYTILVNNTPVGNCENSTDYILGDYTYTFYDTAKNELLTDTLKISIAFNELGTECVLTTSGNGETIKYWNYYFAKNGFVITIEKDGYIKADNWDILTENQLNILTSDISSFAVSVNDFVEGYNLTSLSLDNYLSSVKVENVILETYKNTFSSKQNDIYGLKNQYNLLLSRLNKIDEKHSVSIAGNEQLLQKIETLNNTLIEKLNILENFENACVEKVNYIADCMVANIVSVEFVIDGVVFNSQSIEKKSVPASFEIPAKDGYIFIGWTLNNEFVLNPFAVEITENSVFTAVYELVPVDKISLVFEFDNNIYAYETIEKGTTFNLENPQSTNYVRFNYWTINGQQIDLSTYVFTENTTIVANVTYFHYVNFIVDGISLNSQFVEDGTLAIVPVAPTKEDYNFVGWSIDGVNILDDFTINADKTFVAVFEKIIEMTTLTAVNTIWQHENGTTLNLDGNHIWSFKGNTYYSYFGEEYVLNKETLLWQDKIWYGYNEDDYISGVLIYDNDCYAWIGDEIYILDETTSTFSIPMWQFNEFQNVDRDLDFEYLWTDGVSLYYDYDDIHMKLDKSTLTWNLHNWQNFYGRVNVYSIWTDGFNVYMGCNYVLDVENDTWVSIENNFPVYFNKDGVFCFDGFIYYVYQSNYYVSSNVSVVWEEMQCNIDLKLYGSSFWVFESKLYYSNGNNQFEIVIVKP